MSAPTTAVAFRDDAPMEPFAGMLKTFSTPAGPVRYMDCAEVAETSYGFLRLLPKDSPHPDSVAIYIPPSYVLWMLRSTKEARPGFL